MKTKIVPILRGSPGIGKSQIYQQIADKHNLLLIDIRLAQCDPTDLTGFPKIEGDKAGYVPMDTFPLEGDPIPEGYAGWLLLFDEITGAMPALQDAAYKILLDRKVGKRPLHSKVAMGAAGNLETDNAVVHPMSTAMETRLAHMEMQVNVDEWVEWAQKHGVDHRLTSYIKFKPGNLYTFTPTHTDATYACPRSWEFASRVLKEVGLDDPNVLPLIAGVISEGVAREFIGFCKIYADLPTVAQIVAAPEKVAVPQEPSILFALTGSLAHNATPENCEPLLKYVARLPAEFQVVCLRETVRRNPALTGNPAIQQWIAKSAQAFF